MKTTKLKLRIAGLAGMTVAGMAQPVAAQDESLTVEVSECVELPTPEERLACFEKQVEVARTAPPAQAAPAASSAAPAARAGDAADAAPPQEIVAKVAELRQTVPNAYLITLDNGQIWRQMRPLYYPLRPGSDVRIYQSKWGESYRLTNPQLRGFIQVERVR
jgi:hypothetical protein